MEIFYVLLVLLVITRAFGELAVRFQQPALVGELLSGIVLGAVIKLSPPSFPITNSLTDNEVFTAITGWRKSCLSVPPWRSLRCPLPSRF